MFNGIIFNTGRVQVIKKKKNSIYVGIQTKINFSKKDLGSSVCCDGVCLTVDKVVKRKIFFYISNETLKRSNFKSLKLNQVKLKVLNKEMINFGPIIISMNKHSNTFKVVNIKKQ